MFRLFLLTAILAYVFSVVLTAGIMVVLLSTFTFFLNAVKHALTALFGSDSAFLFLFKLYYSQSVPKYSSITLIWGKWLNL